MAQAVRREFIGGGVIRFGVLTGTVLALVGSSIAVGSTEPPAEPIRPSIEVVTGPDADGLTFEVEGTSWPPDSLVQLELCGNRALNGSTDCRPGAGQTVAANFQGWFLARVSTSPPPVPCPCVVRALGQSGAMIATTPVRVPGVPEVLSVDVEVAEPAVRRLEVVSAQLDGNGPWTAWFGFPPRRTLTVQFESSGTVAVEDAFLTLGIGSLEAPTGFVPPIAIEPLDVGERTTIEVEIEFDALAFGEQAVVGEITGTSEPTTFSATTSSYPWLLIVIPLAIVLQFALLRLRDRVRRRAFPEPVQPLPALPPGVREVDDEIFMISVAADVDPATVAMIQEVLGQPEFIVPVDRSCGPAVFALRGMETVQEFLEVAVDELGPVAVDDPPLTDVVCAVHVAALGNVTLAEARAASTRLAAWLRDDLGVQVWIADDSGAAPVPQHLRISAGIPPVAYRVVLAEHAGRGDALGAADRLSDGNVSVRLAGEAGSRYLCVHIDDWTKIELDRLYDRIAAQLPVRAAAPLGLVPIGLLAQTDPDRWEELGLDVDATFEVRVATAMPREVEPPRELMPPMRELTP